MIFDVSHLIEHVSSIMTIEAGDLLLTGECERYSPFSLSSNLALFLISPLPHQALQRVWDLSGQATRCMPV